MKSGFPFFLAVCCCNLVCPFAPPAAVSEGLSCPWAAASHFGPISRLSPALLEMNKLPSISPAMGSANTDFSKSLFSALILLFAAYLQVPHRWYKVSLLALGVDQDGADEAQAVEVLSPAGQWCWSRRPAVPWEMSQGWLGKARAAWCFQYRLLA